MGTQDLARRIKVRQQQSVGMTLVEVLVVIAILGMLMAIILPAVQSSRQAARKIECQSNLRQVGLAVQQYVETWTCFPTSGDGDGPSFLVRLLPCLEHTPLYKEFDFAKPVIQQDAFARKRPPYFACPSDGVAVSNPYRNSVVGNLGWWEPDSLTPPFANPRLTGVIVFEDRPPMSPQPPVRSADIRDGLSSTAVISEFLSAVDGDPQRMMWLELPLVAQLLPGEQLAQNCLSATTNIFWDQGFLWSKGGVRQALYDHLLPPNRRSCKWVINAGSTHLGGANVGFCDGAIRFASSSIDAKVWHAMGTKAGRESVAMP